MDFGSIIGTIGNMLGGGKKTADGAQTGGLQDIIANLGTGRPQQYQPTRHHQQIPERGAVP